MKNRNFVLSALLYAALVPFALGQEDVVITTHPDVIEESPIEPGACDYLNGGLGTKDFDKDGIDNCEDNCIFDKNKNQRDKDNDGYGHACEWRQRQDEEWDKFGQQQRRSATEPVDLEKLAAESSHILIGRIDREGLQQRFGQLDGHAMVEVVRVIKGAPGRVYQTMRSHLWVYIPDGGPPEIVGTGNLLFFLKNGKVRAWKPPRVFSGTIVNGRPYTETHYFGYDLADLRYGVLGISDQRLKLLEEIIAKQKR